MNIRCLLLVLILMSFESLGQIANFHEKLREGNLFWQQYGITLDTKSNLCPDGVAFPYEIANDSIAQYQPQHCEHLSYLLHISQWIAMQLPDAQRDFMNQHIDIATLLSGLHPAARGAFRKAGWWQLSLPVALRYGLRVDQQVDERMDLLRSTTAAISHLTALKNRYGAEKGLFAFIYDPLSLQSAYANDSIRQHTFAAMASIKTFREALDERTPNATLLKTDTIRFSSEVLISEIAGELGLSTEDFRRLNPTLIGRFVPANYGPVLVPASAKSKLDKAALITSSNKIVAQRQHQADSLRKSILSGTPDPKKYNVVTYRVRSGDYLGAIARKHGVSVSAIKKWNELSSNMIRANQKLVIYLRKGQKVKPTAPTAKKVQRNIVNRPRPNSTGQPDQFEIYEVKQGDTLWSIAQQYEGVSHEDIMEWNNITNERIDIGQELKIKRTAK